jgi:hypothetical protein
MFRIPNFDRVREMFAKQFEADGDDFLYRKNSKGAAFRVTATERDAFIATYNRSLSWMNWGLLGGTTALAAAVIAWAIIMRQDAIEPPLYVGLGLLVTLFMLGWYRLWNAPARALAARSVVAPERSRDEFRRIAMQRLTWSRLAGSTAFFALGLLYLSSKYNLLVGWNRLWLVLAGVIFPLVAYRAFQKWRFEQTGRL